VKSGKNGQEKRAATNDKGKSERGRIEGVSDREEKRKNKLKTFGCGIKPRISASIVRDIKHQSFAYGVGGGGGASRAWLGVILGIAAYVALGISSARGGVGSTRKEEKST